jgi:hypothetical protein
MKLLIRSAMIFFGTLLAAGLLALAEPQAPVVAAVHDAAAPAVLLAGIPAAPPASMQPQR